MGCAGLPVLDSGSLDELAAILIEVSGEYHQLCARHKALSEAVRKTSD